MDLDREQQSDKVTLPINTHDKNFELAITKNLNRQDDNALMGTKQGFDSNDTNADLIQNVQGQSGTIHDTDTMSTAKKIDSQIIPQSQNLETEHAIDPSEDQNKKGHPGK